MCGGGYVVFCWVEGFYRSSSSTYDDIIVLTFLL